jgi:hypothetical protein
LGACSRRLRVTGRGEEVFTVWVSSQCAITRRLVFDYMAVQRRLGHVRKQAVNAGASPTVLFTAASAASDVIDQVLAAAVQGRQLKVRNVSSFTAALQEID